MPAGNNNKPQKNKYNWVLYVVYGVIILLLGRSLLTGDSAVASRDIRWDKLEPRPVNASTSSPRNAATPGRKYSSSSAPSS